MMNVRSWETWVISTLKVILLRNVGIIPHEGKFNRNNNNNGAITNNVMDEILLNKREAPEIVDSNFDENDLYQFEKYILEETKEKFE